MKKIIITILILSIIGFSSVSITHAQDTTTNETSTDGQLPIGIEQDPNAPVDETPEQPSGSTEDSNQQFIKGVAAGLAIGLAVGAIIAWLLKDKFYKK